MTSTELTLKGKAPFKRKLVLRAAIGDLYVSLYNSTGRPQLLAYAIAKISACNLYVGNRYSRGLWLGHACFDVSETEAEQIRATYEPLGLHIEESGEMAATIQLQSSAAAAVHP